MQAPSDKKVTEPVVCIAKMPFAHQGVCCAYPNYWITTQTVTSEPKTLGERFRKRSLEIHVP